MQKQRPIYNHPPGLEKLIPGTRNAIGCWLKKRKIMLVRSTRMETKTKIGLSLTIPLLLIVSLRPRSPKKTNIIEVVKEAI